MSDGIVQTSVVTRINSDRQLSGEPHGAKCYCEHCASVVPITKKRHGKVVPGKAFCLKCGNETIAKPVVGKVGDTVERSEVSRSKGNVLEITGGKIKKSESESETEDEDEN